MDSCGWEVLDETYRAWYGSCLIAAGCVAALGNCWLLGAGLSARGSPGRTDLLLLNLAVACLGRSLLGGFPFAGASALAGRWLFGAACCRMFAATRLVFGCGQSTGLALLGVERAAVSRRPAGSQLPLRFYVAGVLSCWLFSAAWSVPPLFGAGSYGCDCSGTACDVDWSSAPQPQHLPYVFSLMLLAHLLPTTAATAGVWLAATSKNSSGLKSRLQQRRVDKAALWLVTATELLWLPQALLVLWSLSAAEDGPSRGRRRLPPLLVAAAPLAAEELSPWAWDVVSAVVLVRQVAGVLPALARLALRPPLLRGRGDS